MTHDNDRRQNRSKRRTFLKGTAGLAATAGLPAIIGSAAAADPSHEKRYEAALEVRERTGDIEQFREHLRNHGGKVVASDEHFRFSRESSDSDGITPERVKHDDVTLRTTMTKYGSGYDANVYVDLEFDVVYWLNDGDLPVDPIGLGWEEREYDYDNYHYTSNYVDWGGYNTHGVDFHYRDEADDCHCQKTNRYVGCRVAPEAGTPETRYVNTSYWHTWYHAGISSISVDTQGVISFTISEERKRWDRPAQDRINESDAT